VQTLATMLVVVAVVMLKTVKHQELEDLVAEE
jgi:hypothetical protein